MPKLRFPFLGVAAGLLLFPSLVFAEITVRFSPDGNVEEAILRRLDLTRKSIDIAMYSFGHRGISGRVKELAASGKKVRLILNKARTRAKYADAFEKAGVDVRYVNTIMHHKFAIIDGPQTADANAGLGVLLTGSGNWSRSMSGDYDEDFLIFENEPGHINAYQAEFNLLWANARDYPGETKYGDTAGVAAPEGLVTFTSSNMEVKQNKNGSSFRPGVGAEDGAAGAVVIAAINSAHGLIRIAHAHFRRHDIYYALSNALSRGVQVYMILDQAEFDMDALEAVDLSNNRHLDEKLAYEGAYIQYKNYSRFWDYRTAKQMHSKYIIIDEGEVLTGSFNWSDNSEINSMENLVRLSGTEVGAYVQNHIDIGNYGSEDLPGLLKKIKSRKGRGPCAFPAISLSIHDMVKLRGAYGTGACGAKTFSLAAEF